MPALWLITAKTSFESVSRNFRFFLNAEILRSLGAQIVNVSMHLLTSNLPIRVALSAEMVPEVSLCFLPGTNRKAFNMTLHPCNACELQACPDINFRANVLLDSQTKTSHTMEYPDGLRSKLINFSIANLVKRQLFGQVIPRKIKIENELVQCGLSVSFLLTRK